MQQSSAGPMLTVEREPYKHGSYAPELDIEDDVPAAVDEQGRILGPDGRPQRFAPSPPQW